VKLSVGIAKVKLVDRARSTDWILRVVDAYARRRTPGDNLVAILNAVGSGPLPFADFSEFLRAEAASEEVARTVGALAAHPFLFIDNRELDGFVERVKEIDCRRTDCGACGVCAEVAARAVRPNPELSPELAALLPRIEQGLRDWMRALYDGRVYERPPAPGGAAS